MSQSYSHDPTKRTVHDTGFPKDKEDAMLMEGPRAGKNKRNSAPTDTETLTAVETPNGKKQRRGTLGPKSRPTHKPPYSYPGIIAGEYQLPRCLLFLYIYVSINRSVNQSQQSK